VCVRVCECVSPVLAGTTGMSEELEQHFIEPAVGVSGSESESESESV